MRINRKLEHNRKRANYKVISYGVEVLSGEGSDESGNLLLVNRSGDRGNEGRDLVSS